MDMDRLAVETPQTVAEHGALRLVADLLADFDDQVGEDVMIVVGEEQDDHHEPEDAADRELPART